MIFSVTKGTDDETSSPAGELDREGRIALYVQIADLLHAQIDGGEITGRMPSMESIASVYKVGRNTAAAALRLLRREQVIEFSPGHGYYANPPPHPHD